MNHSGDQHSTRSKSTGRNPPKFHYSFVKILTGSDLSHRRLPYMRATSSHPGPAVWLTACSHGDEVGGIIVIQEVFRRIKRQSLLRGSVHAFPLMNPLGFEAAARHITLSEEDLNRAFPGNPAGTFAERIAHTIFQRIVDTSPDVVLDLHNDWIRSIPYTVLDAPSDSGSPDGTRCAQLLADVTGFLVVNEPNPVRRTLSHSLLQFGIPAVTIELGESYVVNETNVEFGFRSVWNVLGHLEMVENPETFRHPASALSADTSALTYCQEPVSSTSGIVRFLVRPGVFVKQGQQVAKIVNALGRLQEVMIAPKDAVVLGLSDSSVAYPGAPVMAFAQLVSDH